jgi:N-acyl-D-aspartate/D-glutamate deacylase
MSHASGKNPFSTSKHYQNARSTAAGDNTILLRLLAEPGLKEAIMDEMLAFESMGQGMMGEQLRNKQGAIVPAWMINGQLCYPFTDTYEPTSAEMIPAIAERMDRSPLEVMWDLLMDVDGSSSGVLWRPLFDYQGNNDNIVQGLGMPNIIPGFDDAGAHCTILTDATCATTNLHYYGRDRVAGDGQTVPMETIIKTQTMDAARIFGLEDRGVLAAGMRADINIIDMDKLKVGKPYWVNDLPTHAGRWLQHTEGYRATILRGVVTFEHDQHTGMPPVHLTCFECEAFAHLLACTKLCSISSKN